MHFSLSADCRRKFVSRRGSESSFFRVTAAGRMSECGHVWPVLLSCDATVQTKSSSLLLFAGMSASPLRRQRRL